MNKKRKIIFTTLLAVAGLTVAFVVRKGDGAQGRRKTELLSLLQQPRPVGMQQVGGPLAASAFTYPAVVEAGETAELAFRVSGPLVQVAAFPGKRVAQGDVLMQIDPRDYEDKMASLTAALAGARAALGKAEADFSRAETLLSNDVIAQSDYDEASAQRELSQARVKELLAAVQSAQHALSDTSLIAPFSGIITQQKIENFEMVAAGKPVLTLLNTGFVDVVIHVPEEDLAAHRLEAGAPATVRILSIADSVFDAAVKEWSLEADAITRSYTVTFGIKMPEDVPVWPGMTAEVAWTPEGRGAGAAAVSVPVGAVCRDNGSSVVWVYDEDTQTARKQPVETGRQTGRDQLEIIKGLAVGDVIVTAGADFVQAGMKLIPLSATDLD